MIKSVEPLSLNLTASNWYFGYPLTLLAGICAALWSLPVSFPLRQVALIVVVSLLVLHSVRRWGDRPVALRLDGQGAGCIRRCERVEQVRSASCTYYTSGLVILRLELERGDIWLPLFRDQMTGESWRQLRRRFASEIDS